MRNWKVSLISLAVVAGLTGVTGCSLSGDGQPVVTEETDYSKIVMTVDPDNKPTMSYQEFLASQNPDSSILSPETVYQTDEPVVTKGTATMPQVMVIVNKTLYSQIKTNVDRYVYDLELDGYRVHFVSIYNNQKPADLKNLIKNYYSSYGIQGAVLIGHLPVAWFEIWKSNQFEDKKVTPNLIKNTTYDSFPSDYYYMDLNGDWADNSANQLVSNIIAPISGNVLQDHREVRGQTNGIFDYHGGSAYQADIWVGRITVGNTSSSLTEAQQISRYLEKNRKYRRGQNRLRDRGISLINPDWGRSGFETAHNLLYPTSHVSLVSPNQAVTAPVYTSQLRKLTDNQYESVLLAAHSHASAHRFDHGGHTWFDYNEIESYTMQANFYNLFACSSGRFTDNNCLAVGYTMQSNYGLTTVASSKSGSMLNFENYYRPILEGNSLGYAFRSWFLKTVTTESWHREWFYGMVMMGDPTLKISRFMSKNPEYVLGYNLVADYDRKLIFDSKRNRLLIVNTARDIWARTFNSAGKLDNPYLVGSQVVYNDHDKWFAYDSKRDRLLVFNMRNEIWARGFNADGSLGSAYVVSYGNQVINSNDINVVYDAKRDRILVQNNKNGLRGYNFVGAGLAASSTVVAANVGNSSYLVSDQADKLYVVTINSWGTGNPKAWAFQSDGTLKSTTESYSVWHPTDFLYDATLKRLLIRKHADQGNSITAIDL